MPPAIGLLAAAGSVSAGMAAVGGTMAGFAAAGIGTQLVAGALIAGGVMTGIGVLTGSKKLQKWGGILGLAGGIAGLASGAWSSTAQSIAADAPTAGFGGAEYGMAQRLTGTAAGGLGDAAGSLVQANMGAGMGVGDFGAGGAQPWQTPGINPGANPAGPSVTAPSIPTTVNIVNGGGTQGTAGGWQGVADGLKQRVSDMLPATGSSSGGGMLSSIGGTIKDGFEWAGKSDANARIVQAGAGLLTAGLSGYAQQEALKDQMRMQEEAQARARKRLSDSVQGVNVPVYQRKGG